MLDLPSYTKCDPSECGIFGGRCLVAALVCATISVVHVIRRDRKALPRQRTQKWRRFLGQQADAVACFGALKPFDIRCVVLSCLIDTVTARLLGFIERAVSSDNNRIAGRGVGGK